MSTHDTPNTIGVTVSQRYIAQCHNGDTADFLRWCDRQKRHERVVPFKLTKKPQVRALSYVLVALGGTARGYYRLTRRENGITPLDAQTIAKRFRLDPQLFKPGWYALCDRTTWNTDIPHRKPANIRSNYYTTITPR